MPSSCRGGSTDGPAGPPSGPRAEPTASPPARPHCPPGPWCFCPSVHLSQRAAPNAQTSPRAGAPAGLPVTPTDRHDLTASWPLRPGALMPFRRGCGGWEGRPGGLDPGPCPQVEGLPGRSVWGSHPPLGVTSSVLPSTSWTTRCPGAITPISQMGQWRPAGKWLSGLRCDEVVDGGLARACGTCRTGCCLLWVLGSPGRGCQPPTWQGAIHRVPGPGGASSRLELSGFC